MPKLIMLRGVPGSGKTYLARQLVREEPAHRINRDDLRAMLDNGVYARDLEESIKVVEINLAGFYLEQGENVVIDDTNLKPEDRARWLSWAAIYHAELVVIEMDTPLEVCIERDAQREKPVGEARIRQMFEFLTHPEG